ncbi:SGNH/GDSL hydrolase family protein [Pedobacter sp.]|uniref:SGNH/GDSL hydrolase family protein n=1 Tax=Pedobacter sp. TaxID=1411316 RepID=UPI003D7F8A1A
MGNSITEAGFYESNIWLYYMTHFPELKISIINAGIGGDVVKQMNDRFEDDVLPKKPSVVVLTFGMNDSGYFEFNETNAAETSKQRIQDSRQYFNLLEAKLKALPQVKKVIMSSSPYDETMTNKNGVFNGKSKAMEQIVQFQQLAAKSNSWAYVDLFHPMTEINLKEQQIKPEFTLTGPDRIHPGKGGHLIMAALFLKNQGLAGLPVAEVEIDVKKGLVKAENAKVSLIKKSKSIVSFDYYANSLPFPIDSISDVWENPQKQSDVLGVYPFIQEFNQEIFKVKNLSEGTYHLMIDGRKINTFSAESFSKGVNLALLNNTPQYEQAQSLMHLNDLRAELEKKLREYYWLHFNYLKGENLLFNDSELAFQKVSEKAKTDWAVRSKIASYQTSRFPEIRSLWESNIKQLTDKIYQLNKPNSHLIEIVATK